jgi:hypothetical protein
MDPMPGAALAAPIRVRALSSTDEVDSLSGSDLSDLFNPFLGHFMREVLGGGGEVLVTGDGPNVTGILTFNAAERVASIFARERAVAEVLFSQREHLTVFSDFALSPGAETYQVYSTELPEWDGSHRFSHPVRAAVEADRVAILRFMQEMYGRVEESWLQSLPRPGEPCFLVEVEGQLAGVGWASVVNRNGRLHSLSVHPRYRRMHVGTDLWYARMLWTQQAGADRVLCEIADHNLASRAIATTGGMRPIGQIFHSRRP